MNYLVLIVSVLIGGFVVFFKKTNIKFTRLLVSFSGAYLLSITILHLLPEVYEHTNNIKEIGGFILVGILVQFILESFSKGIEHGHIHMSSDSKHFDWLFFISLCIHAFFEGIPVDNEHNHNNSFLWAIVVHKIPISIVLTTFLIQSKYSKKYILMFLTIFALMSPLGIFIADKIHFFSMFHTQITAIVIGIFLHISTIILFESSENHTFNFQKFIAILLGILITMLTL